MDCGKKTSFNSRFWSTSAITALWLDMFAEVEPGLIGEAIMRFLDKERKGFFPSPGQIKGIIEDIQGEQKEKAMMEQTQRHYEKMRKHQQHIDGGKNCGTCRFCAEKEKGKVWDKRRAEIGLFCQNPKSYKFEGEGGYGTVASILCEFYEAKK